MYIKRALIIAAHPDDDILGCGGLMSQLKHVSILRCSLLQKDLLVASQILYRWPKRACKRTQMATRTKFSIY